MEIDEWSRYHKPKASTSLQSCKQKFRRKKQSGALNRKRPLSNLKSRIKTEEVAYTNAFDIFKTADNELTNFCATNPHWTEENDGGELLTHSMKWIPA